MGGGVGGEEESRMGGEEGGQENKEGGVFATSFFVNLLD